MNGANFYLQPLDINVTEINFNGCLVLSLPWKRVTVKKTQITILGEN